MRVAPTPSMTPGCLSLSWCSSVTTSRISRDRRELPPNSSGVPRNCAGSPRFASKVGMNGPTRGLRASVRMIEESSVFSVSSPRIKGTKSRASEPEQLVEIALHCVAPCRRSYSSRKPPVSRVISESDEGSAALSLEGSAALSLSMSSIICSSSRLLRGW